MILELLCDEPQLLEPESCACWLYILDGFRYSWLKSQIVGALGEKKELGIVYPGIFLSKLDFFPPLFLSCKCSGDGIPGNYGPAWSPQN